jgi:hypothetical protein
MKNYVFSIEKEETLSSSHFSLTYTLAWCSDLQRVHDIGNYLNTPISFLSHICPLCCLHSFSHLTRQSLCPPGALPPITLHSSPPTPSSCVALGMGIVDGGVCASETIAVLGPPTWVLFGVAAAATGLVPIALCSQHRRPNTNRHNLSFCPHWHPNPFHAHAYPWLHEDWVEE